MINPFAWLHRPMGWLNGICLAVCALPGFAETDQVVLIQSTTSTQNSGLYDVLLPQAEAALGLDIRVVAVGTGQALQNAARCDGDLVIVHDRQAEEAFVTAGFGTVRHVLMYNDFVLIGPGDDPAGARAESDITQALAAIARDQVPFVSRGDDSGTHKAELRLWPDTRTLQAASGGWYRETGSGMGATLNIAVAMGAYTISDRASWLSFENRQNHQIVLEGDPALFNPYGAIPVSPEHCPNTNIQGAEALTRWLVSPEGQAAIAGFQHDDQPLFFPNAAN